MDNCGQVLTRTAAHLVMLVAALTVPASALAQVSSAPSATPVRLPRVFLDCQGRLPCDRDHFRTEIRFVDWVQDREDADVHVIVTSESVGGGGSRITLDLIGRGGMAHITDRLAYTARGSDVEVETLDGITHVLRLGLLRFGVESGLASSFQLLYSDTGSPRAPDDDLDPTAAPGTARSDPWNHWTFRLALSVDLDLRETRTDIEINPEFSVERITDEWKVGLELEVDVERSRRELSGDREVRDDRNEWEVDGLVVRSISDHFSVGFAFEGESSVSENQDARVELAPAVEYNYFPYSMANRRQLTVQYAGGVEYSDYREETIFRVHAELRPRHELRVRYNARDPWGNAGVGISYSQYLNDFDLYRAELNGSLNFRIARGLDLTLSGSSSWVNDQIHVPLSDISDEDILLGRQSLPSSYQYTARVGLAYRWGSAFTNIVNPRFGG